MHLKFPQCISTDGSMGFTIDCNDFPDIVEKSRFFRQEWIFTHLCSESFTDPRYFDTMLSEVLSITISEVKPTDIVDDLWFHHRDIEHRESFLSFVHDDLIDTSECLGVELLYIKWIDTTIFQ